MISPPTYTAAGRAGQSYVRLCKPGPEAESDANDLLSLKETQ